MSDLLIDVMVGVPDGTIPPETRRIDGTNYQALGMAFDAAADAALHFELRLPGYTGGNLTLSIPWFPETATSGDVVWAAQIIAVTPNADDVDWDAEAYATVQTVTDTALGGTNAQRPHEAVLTISNLDSLADGDLVMLRLSRDADNGSDDMAGYATIRGQLKLSYS